MVFDNVTDISLGSKNWGLSGSIHKPDRVLSQPIFADLGGIVNNQYGWEFFVDTDVAGNAVNEVLCAIFIPICLNAVLFW